MPTSPVIDVRLNTLREQLGVLVSALARGDLDAIEASSGEVAKATAGLDGVQQYAGEADGESYAPAVAEMRWLMTRCRRLGRTFESPAAPGAATYRPDGRSQPASTNAPRLEVIV